MLARTFLTAEQLNIPQEWVDALVKTLDAMERGEFLHTPECQFLPGLRDYDQVEKRKLFLGRFNMVYWQESTDCGTICCIGGAAEFIGKVRFGDHNNDLPHPLHCLFYPDGESELEYDYSMITVDHAAQALRNYLTLGEPRWKDILPKEVRYE